MDSKIPEDLLERIEETPSFLLVGSIKDSSVRNKKIALTINNLKQGQSLVYSQEEAIKMFGKNFRASLKTSLKNYGVKRPAVCIEKDKVYVFNRCEV